MSNADRTGMEWKRARATVELCARRRRDRYRYAITVSYPVEGDLFITDVVSETPLREGSKVLVEYDPLDPRVNSLNHPRREGKAFRVALILAGLGLFLLLIIALIGL
jgi:hypothetical protein